MIKKLVNLTILLLCITTISATTILNIDSNPQGATIYINGQPNGNTTNSISFNISADTTIELNLTLDGYESYSENILLHPNDTVSKSITLNSSKEIEAKNKISETESYLDSLKNKYSDSYYISAMNDAYDLISKAKTYYNNNDYDNAIKYCDYAKNKGDQIYDTWNNIKNAEAIIYKYKNGKTENGIHYTNYGANIYSYESSLSTAKSKFNSGYYDDAEDYANSAYSGVKRTISVIDDIEKLEEDIEDLESELSDSSLELHPKINSIDKYISDAKNKVDNNDISGAEDAVDNANSKLKTIENQGKDAKEYIKDVKDKLNTAVHDYKNIDRKDAKDRYDKALEEYDSAKEKYNKEDFESAETHAENAESELKNTINWYKSRKNSVLSSIDSARKYYNRLINLRVIIPLSIQTNIDDAEEKCNNGYFNDAENLTDEAYNDLSTLESNWKNAKKSISDAEEHMKDLRNNSEGIVLTDAEQELNKVKSTFNNGKYDIIPTKCENVKTTVDEIKRKYDYSKNSLNSLNNKLNTLKENGWNIDNALKKYEEIVNIHKSGDYILSKNKADKYLSKINSAETSVNSANDYIANHKQENILNIWIVSIDFTNELNKLEESKHLFNLADYDGAKQMADEVQSDAINKYNNATGNIIPMLLGAIGFITLVGAIIVGKHVINKKKEKEKEDIDDEDDDYLFEDESSDDEDEDDEDW
jgi:tetratricopeptide (TPR) repeat protein